VVVVVVVVVVLGGIGEADLTPDAIKERQISNIACISKNIQGFSYENYFFVFFFFGRKTKLIFHISNSTIYTLLNSVT
jgi:hypothetical protein